MCRGQPFRFEQELQLDQGFDVEHWIDSEHRFDIEHRFNVEHRRLTTSTGDADGCRQRRVTKVNSPAGR
jgi:hypothetical protein